MRRSHGSMELMSEGCPDNAHNIFGIDAAARHEENAATRRLRKTRQSRERVRGARLASGGQDARRAGLDNILQQRLQIP